MHNINNEFIIKFLIENVSASWIVLFGSYGKGTAHAESDIDIAFLSDHNYSDYQIFLFAQKLADKLGKEVDLVQLNKASTVFQAQIVGSGKTIFCNDEKKKMLFRMRALKAYAKLNEEREPVLNAIKESGTIYGR